MAGAAAATILCGSSDAEASGFSVARFGTAHGHPVTSNATALYFNPAGIASAKGLNVFVDVLGGYRSAEYENVKQPEEPDEPADAQGANYGTGTLLNAAVIPSIGATARFPLGDDVGLGVGAGFFVPFGGQAVWDTNAGSFPNYAGPQNGVQRWWSIDGTLRTSYLTFGAAIDIMDTVFIGVSGGPAFTTIDTIRARNGVGDSNDVTDEGRAWLNTSGTHAHLGFGVMVKPVDEFKLGFSYQAPPGLGEMRVNGNLNIFLGGTVTGDTEADKVDLVQNLPDVFRFGVALRPIDLLELRVDGDFHRWSLFQNQCIVSEGQPCEVNDDGSEIDDGDPNTPPPRVNLPRRWNDAGGVRLGVSVFPSDDFEVFGLVGYDSNAIPDETLDPALTDFDDINVGAGVRYRFVDELAAALSYHQFIYISRDTTGKYRDFQFPSNGPDAGGKYSQSIGFVNLNVQFTYDLFDEGAQASAPKSRQAAKGQAAQGQTASNPLGGLSAF